MAKPLLVQGELRVRDPSVSVAVQKAQRLEAVLLDLVSMERMRFMGAMMSVSMLGSRSGAATLRITVNFSMAASYFTKFPVSTMTPAIAARAAVVGLARWVRDLGP